MKISNNIKTPIKSIVLFFIAIFLYSCESLIDVDLPNDRMNQEDVYKDVNTTKSALNAIYINIRNNPFFSKNSSGINYRMSLYTDELNYLGSSAEYFNQNNILPNDNIIINWWNTAYKNIYGINLFINKLSESTYIDASIKNQFLGEAYTLRALHYQNLLQLFGDLPYTTSIDYSYNTSLNKIPINEVLLLIEKDLLLAIDLLSDTYRDTNRFYVNKSVAELLLAENYLLQQRNDQAEIYSQNVINNSQYQIEVDLSQTFKKIAKSTIWQFSLEQNTTITPEASLYIFTALSTATTALSSKLIDLFEPEDLRRANWINEIPIDNQVYYGVFKYKNKTNNTDESSIFYRIEHAYFFLAESLFKQEKNIQAIEVLNKIRNKRGLTPLEQNLSKKKLEEALLNESFKEFFTESNQRFFTLKRFDRLDELKSTKTNWQDYHKLLPIPESQLLLNKNLNPQNSGY